MRHIILECVVAAVAILAFSAAASGQLFEADSKRLGDARMDIVVREVERRDRASVLEVTIKARGSSVGGSMFVLCSVRRLAGLRGGYRHIVKLDDQPKRGQMLVGFLRTPHEDPRPIAPEFQALKPGQGILHLGQFAEVCAFMN